MSFKIKAELKIALYLVFLVSLYIYKGTLLYVLYLPVMVLLLSRVPFKRLKAGWLPITLFLLFTFLSNVFNRPGKIVLTIYSLTLTEDGLLLSALKALRLLYLILGAKILMASARPEEIVEALGRMMKPFERLGLPVMDFFHTMGLTIKCFPVLKDRMVEIFRSSSRTNPEEGFWKRTGNTSELLMKMFVESVSNPEAFFEKKEINRQ